MTGRIGRPGQGRFTGTRDAAARSLRCGRTPDRGVRSGQAPPGGRTEWLAGRLRTATAHGTLPVGSRLPGTRILAAELCVSWGLVAEAYQRLAETGQASGRVRGGTVVVAALRAVPCRIDPSRGVPDLTAFPRTAWLQAERQVLAALTPQGAPALRESVVGRPARNRGIRAAPDEVVRRGRRPGDGLPETGPKVFPERRQPPGGSRVVRG
ncbi:GntR family transcriptional regulator [Streptomyces sp. NPDC059552]|uniref:GntR family transcriptional regulator n=1 Tax=Streptomyces sp. NPDC059552 TaxID=3346862 RepID=UPI0036BE523B